MTSSPTLPSSMPDEKMPHSMSPSMRFQPDLPPGRLEKSIAAGYWGDTLFAERFESAAIAALDRVAVVSENSETLAVTTLSYRHLLRLARRAAAGLVQLGIGRGDVVAMQLPNWWHYAVMYPACAYIGAVFNPLMPIFRERELEFMLGFAQTKLLVIPNSFRGFSYPAMLERLRPALPSLEHVLVADAPWQGPSSKTDHEMQSFESTLLEPRWEDDEKLMQRVVDQRPGAGDVTELMYTSGTTGQPKGVMHTANTLLCKARFAKALFGLTDDDVVYMGSPLAHQTGFMYAVVFPLIYGLKCVLQDVWDPVVAARKIQGEKCTITLGSTPFLSDLVNNPNVRDYDLSSLRLFLCAGAPIPRVLLREAARVLPDLYVMSAWGMTENGIVTATYPGDPEEKVFESDGRALPGQEVRVVDDDGQAVPSGQEGRLQSRGPTTFVGYFNLPKPHGDDQDSEWFDTGDNARMDRDGYIRITGRSKDIIIRGGENVPVVEVEELIYRHESVVDAAVVAIPDERLGERGCAFVQLKQGTSLTLDELVSFLLARKLTKTYLPERLELVSEFPRTPSGKIQKFKLRAQATKMSA